MRKIISLLVIIVILLGAFSACAIPNGVSESDSKLESDSVQPADSATDKTTEDIGSNETEKETQVDTSSDIGNGGNSDGDEPSQKYTREGNYIYFGEYPQSLKQANVTVGATTDSRGYFLGSDNAYYAKIIAAPYESGYKFSTNAIVTNGSEYYFKVEPIKWRILFESDGSALLLCESIIENKAYDSQSNNYKESEIRKWLNESFYNNAFDELERNLIQAVTLDNGIDSTGYSVNSNVCENTEDKIFLLSYADVTNESYGLAEDIERMRSASDYSLANGAWISTSEVGEYYGNGLWMLRTPNNTYSHFIRECNFNGEVTDGGTNLSNSFLGVVPALKIKL